MDPGLSFEEAENFIRDVFCALGVPEGDSRLCADVILTADRMGITSHGVNRMKPFYYDRIRKGLQSPVTELDIIRESPSTAVIDGHTGMGMVIAAGAMGIAIEKASEYGMGMAVVRNSTHYGIAGYYARMAAFKGMIGMSGTNARPSVAPTFGTEGMLGTNPLAVGIPTDEDFPFLLDCATSLTQRGKIEYYARLGKEVPDGWVIGADGTTMTDPAAILKALTNGQAALVPLGGPGEEGAGYKGYGLSTVIEVLSSALQGGAFLKSVTGLNVGHFFIAIDVESFCDPEEFKASTGEILRQLRSSRRIGDRVFTAGEKEYLSMLASEERGIPLDESLKREFMAMRDELGLDHRFAFEE
ncbi:MAG: Ldh family oxidoreductase [Candidatus Thermoplasmatota archaeon]|nr:Ldh family oxidoreductase [Candidatus Thermoplasmatota archaeon]